MPHTRDRWDPSPRHASGYSARCTAASATDACADAERRVQQTPPRKCARMNSHIQHVSTHAGRNHLLSKSNSNTPHSTWSCMHSIHTVHVPRTQADRHAECPHPTSTHHTSYILQYIYTLHHTSYNIHLHHTYIHSTFYII